MKMCKYVLSIITLLVLSVCGEITVDKNAYKGIVIAMRDDLDGANCIENFNSIKNMLGNASELLYSSTGNRLRYGEIKVVVPESWDCGQNANPSEGIRLTDAHVMVGPSHPVFGSNPWTQQPRGCGEQGDFIYIPEGYLNSPSQTYGTTAQVFVQEWAKFRWGVFEESGHSGDATFPPSYQSMLNDSLTLLPNYCTNKEIVGEQSCTDSDVEMDCIFTPSTNGSNNGITSSLLSVPFLKNVVHFCNSSTHKSDIPSKHNFLCEGKSVWDVINNSTDMSENISPNDTPEVPTVTLLKAASPSTERIVIAMEYSKITALNEDTWEFLRDTVKQFIEIKVKTGSEVGLIQFSNEVKTLSELTALSNSQNRTALSSKVTDEKPKSDITKDLNMVISTAASLLNKDRVNGVIILLTANQEPININEDDLNKLVLAADGNSVWPILYPHKENTDISKYQELAKRTNGHVYAIKSTTHQPPGAHTPYQDVVNYYDMSSKMLQVQSNIGIEGTLIEIGSGNCNAQDANCNVNLEVVDPELYEDDCTIEVYFAVGDRADTTIENHSDAEKVDLQTYTAYTIKGKMSNSYTVSVNRPYTGDTVKLTLLATKKVKSSDYTIKVSASPSLDNLQYTPTTAPVIYAQVTKHWNFVYYASITATVGGQNISLHDNGIEADVTGNDGIYSAYLLGISDKGDINFTISVNDNSGTAKVIEIQKKAVPSKPADKWCCGSEIDLNDVNNLVPAVNLNAISSIISGTVTGDLDLSGLDLPPGRASNLTASVMGTGTDNSPQITLNFITTGNDLNQGIVSSYKVKSVDSDDEYTCGNADKAESGTRISCSFTISKPSEDALYTYYLVAVDENSNEGKPSNKVRVFVPKNIPIINPPTGLGAGAIAGIVIGVLLFLILVILGVMLFLGKDNKEESFAWNIVLCKCCKKEEEDNIYNKDPPTSARSNDVIRNPTVEPIRSIEDLYAKPDMDAKKRNKTEKIEDEYDDEDGGFTSHRSQSNDIPLQNNYAKKNTVERSSQQNLPINQVGIPIPENPSLQRNQGGNIQSNERNTYNQRYSSNQNYGGNNNAYDASYDYGANYSQPQTGRAPQTLTQV